MTTKTADTTEKRKRRKAIVRATAQPSFTRTHAVHLLLWGTVLFLFGYFLYAVSAILLPFVVGAIMAYLFDPLADRMEKHIGRGNATAVITLGFFSLLVALLAWLGPLLYHQLSELIAKVPDLMRAVESLVREKGAPAFEAIGQITNKANGEGGAPSNAGDIIERAFALGGEMLLSVLASGGALLNVLSLLCITPIVSFYLLRDWDKGIAKTNALLPLAYAPTIRALARDINRTLAGYLRGQFYVMLILAVYYVLFLTLIGLKFSLVIGVIAGLLVIVPYIGTWISTLIALAVAYSQYDISTPFWFVVGVFGIGQVLESQILTPHIIGNKVDLHPLWMLFGMLAGGVLLGFVGVLLAVPITAIISVLVKFVIGLYLDSSLYTDK
ncbi:MAG: AI-2E family transporter [Azospirillum brasilense]|nr:MAG: AI-2E family transporter [Azospirillum brasilense]